MLYLEDTESDPECDGMLSHTLPFLLWFIIVAIVGVVYYFLVINRYQSVDV